MTSTAPSDDPELYTWLLERIAFYVERPATRINPTMPLAEYGMNSVGAMCLCGDLEDELSLYVDPTIVWDHPTLKALHGRLVELRPDRDGAL